MPLTSPLMPVPQFEKNRLLIQIYAVVVTLNACLSSQQKIKKSKDNITCVTVECYADVLHMLSTGEVLEMLTHEAVELTEVEDAALLSP